MCQPCPSASWLQMTPELHNEGPHAGSSKPPPYVTCPGPCRVASTRQATRADAGPLGPPLHLDCHPGQALGSLSVSHPVPEPAGCLSNAAFGSDGGPSKGTSSPNSPKCMVTDLDRRVAAGTSSCSIE